jgi:hypothetical protein
MASKYADILSAQWDDLPQPKLLPDGTWLLRGSNASYFPGDEENDKSARVAFFYEVKEPMEDVRQEDLDALGEGYDFANNDIVAQFYINRPKDWAKVREHLEAHGIDPTGKTQEQTFEEFKGTEVLAHITQNTYVKKATGQEVTVNTPTLFAKV